MAKKQWTKQKVNPKDINNGNEYDIGDQLSLEALNAIVNNSFYGAEHGGSGGDYTAGNGLKLTDKEFSIDTNVVAQQTDLNKALFSSTTNEEVWLIPVRPTLNYNNWNTTTLTMNFRSGSKNFKQFKILLDHSDDLGLIYDSTRVYTRTFTQDFWLNESYRTIILQEPASGNIKTWLQNIGAVKQGEAGTPNKNTGDVGIIKQKTGDNFYPKTFIDAVYDDNGNPLNNLMPVANPTLDGTETNLTALSVNGTKYKIPAGGGSGGDYIAGNGINITDKTISADTNVLATKEDIPTGETDITFNGTPTTTSEDLSNVVIGDKTYLVPSNTEVNAMKVTINNSLQLPETAPTSTELVGIDTNKAQVNISVGDGLSIENGTLKATGGGGGGSGVFVYLVEITSNPEDDKDYRCVFQILHNNSNLTWDDIVLNCNDLTIPASGYVTVSTSVYNINYVTINTDVCLIAYNDNVNNTPNLLEVRYDSGRINLSNYYEV